MNYPADMNPEDSSIFSKMINLKSLDKSPEFRISLMVNMKKSTLHVCLLHHHSMAITNLNKSEELVTNTTAASKYISKTELSLAFQNRGCYQ